MNSNLPVILREHFDKTKQRNFSYLNHKNNKNRLCMDYSAMIGISYPIVIWGGIGAYTGSCSKKFVVLNLYLI